jgi:hypothetical protein
MGLIGHQLNPDKLAAKIPRNLSGLDMYLVWRAKSASYLLAGTFSHFPIPWAVNPGDTVPICRSLDLHHNTPSLADISLYYQLD